MNWNDTLKRYKTGQFVTVQVEKVDHVGIRSTLDDGAVGYTKRAEALLTRRVVNLHQHFCSGQRVQAGIIGFNSKLKTIDLSFRQAAADPWQEYVKGISVGDIIQGDVVLLTESKAIVEIKPGITGVLPRSEMWMRADTVDQILMVDDRIRLQVLQIDDQAKSLLLSAKGLFEQEQDSQNAHATFKMEEKLTSAMQVYRWRQTRQMQRTYSLSDTFRSRFKTVYILIQENAVAESLVLILHSFNVQCSRIDLQAIQRATCDLKDAMIVAGAAAMAGLLSEHIPDNVPVLVVGTAEELASQSFNQKNSTPAARLLKIPHSAEELVNALNDLADDKPVESADDIEYSDFQAAPTEDWLDEQDLKVLLLEIKRLTNASFVAVFQLNLNSMETETYATTLDELRLSEFDRGHLQFSPIRDVIIDGDFVFEQGGGFNFKYMKPLGFFESLVGIKINITDNWGYGLFFFGNEKKQFSTLERSFFNFCEMAVRAKIEHAKLLEKTITEQKFLIAGKMTANFMHEVKNHIQAMDYWLEILKTDSIHINAGRLKGSDETFLARFEQSIDGARDCAKRTRNIEELFLRLLRRSEMQEILLTDFLQDFVGAVAPIAAKSEIKISVDAPASLMMRSSKASLNQILINLFLNSLDFIPLVRQNSGEIRISAFRRKEDSLPIKIEFRDNGPGVNESNREKIFELLFTTKIGGSGLGLAISRRLATEMGGRLFVSETQRLSGVVFMLELPNK